MKQTLYFLMALVVLSCSKDSDGSSEPETLREYMESNSFFVQRIGVIEEGRIPAENVFGVITTTHLITFDFSLPDAIRTLKTYQYNTETYKIEDGCYLDGGTYSIGEWNELEFGITQIKVTLDNDILRELIIEKKENGDLRVRNFLDFQNPTLLATIMSEKNWMNEYGLNYCLD